MHIVSLSTIRYPLSSIGLFTHVLHISIPLFLQHIPVFLYIWYKFPCSSISATYSSIPLDLLHITVFLYICYIFQYSSISAIYFSIPLYLSYIPVFLYICFLFQHSSKSAINSIARFIWWSMPSYLQFLPIYLPSFKLSSQIENNQIFLRNFN